MWPNRARKWSREEIHSDCRQSKEAFRQRRLDEPKELYLQAFDNLEEANKDIINCLDGLLAKPLKPRLIADVIRDNDLLHINGKVIWYGREIER